MIRERGRHSEGSGIEYTRQKTRNRSLFQRVHSNIQTDPLPGADINGEETIRIVSAREASKRERGIYFRQFTIKTGTIFEDSPLGMDKWPMTMVVNCKNGVSSYEIHRAIGVAQ